jgi:hypothetical protein
MIKLRDAALLAASLALSILLAGCPENHRPSAGDDCTEPGATATAPDGRTVVCTREPTGPVWRYR